MGIDIENLTTQRLFAELHRQNAYRLYCESLRLVVEAELRCDELDKHICVEDTANQIQEFLNGR